MPPNQNELTKSFKLLVIDNDLNNTDITPKRILIKLIKLIN